MPGNEKLTLEIEAKTIGEELVNRLATSLEKVVDISTKTDKKLAEPKKTGFEEFPSKIQEFVEAPLQSAQRLLSDFAKGLGPVGIAAAGTVGAIGAIAAASYEAAKSLGELGMQNQRLSIVTGLSTREVGLYQFAAKAAGSDIGVLEGTMRKLSQGLADGGEEGKKVAQALAAAGIQTRGLNGDILPMGDIFVQIGDKMAGMSNAAERNAFAIKTLGRAGIEAVPMLMHLRENLSDADKIGLGITDDEQTRYLDLYKKKIEEVDGAWSVAKRHFEEGIAGTFTLEVSGKLANLFDALVSGDPSRAIDSKKLFGVNVDEWQMSQGSISTHPVDHSGDAIAKSFQASRQNTKEGIEARIADLEHANAESEARIVPGVGAVANQQSVDSINANQKLIDGLRAQLKQMEYIAGEPERMRSMRKSGGEKALTDPLAKMIYAARQLYDPRASDDDNAEAAGYGTADIQRAARVHIKSLGDEAEKQREHDAKGVAFEFSKELQARIRQDERDDADAKRAAEEARRIGEEASRHDNIQMRGINDTAERQARIAGIGARPEDAIAVASTQKNIREQAIAQDMAVLQLSKDKYDIEDKMYELLQRGNAVQIDFNEKLTDQYAKRDEEFRATSGSLFDAMLGGGKGIRGFFIGASKDIGKTVFENATTLIEPQIAKFIPRASDPKSTIGKLLAGTPFGADPMKSAIDLNTLAQQENTAALQNFWTSAASGAAPGVLGSNPLADFPASLPGASGIAAFASRLPGVLSGPGSVNGSGVDPSLISGDPDAISDITSDTTFPVGSPIHAAALKLGTTAGDVAAGAALVGGISSAIEGFGGSGSGGVNAKLNGVAGIAGSASAIMSMIPAIASAIPIAGAAVAAALPLIASFIPNGPQRRANQIWKTLTQDAYQAPTALNETMTTNGNYSSIDSRGNLIQTGFSARPQVTDPYLFWGPNNTPVRAPGSVTSPFSPQAGGAPMAAAPAPEIHLHIHANDAASFVDMATRNRAGLSNAIAGHIQGGPSLLLNTIQNKLMGR